MSESRVRALQCRNTWCSMHAKMDTVLVRTYANTPPGATAAGDTEQRAIRGSRPRAHGPITIPVQTARGTHTGPTTLIFLSNADLCSNARALPRPHDSWGFGCGCTEQLTIEGSRPWAHGPLSSPVHNAPYDLRRATDPPLIEL